MEFFKNIQKDLLDKNIAISLKNDNETDEIELTLSFPGLNWISPITIKSDPESLDEHWDYILDNITRHVNASITSVDDTMKILGKKIQSVNMEMESIPLPPLSETKEEPEDVPESNTLVPEQESENVSMSNDLEANNDFDNEVETTGTQLF